MSDCQEWQICEDRLEATYELSGLIEDIFNMDLQVGVITDPSANLQRIVEQIESERRCGIARVSFNTIHGEDASIIQASDFSVGTIFDPTAVDMGAKRTARDQQINTVLLTGLALRTRTSSTESWLIFARRNRKPLPGPS